MCVYILMMPPPRSMEDTVAASYDDSGQLIQLDEQVALERDSRFFCLPSQVTLTILQQNICTSFQLDVELMLSPELHQHYDTADVAQRMLEPGVEAGGTPLAAPIQVYRSHLDRATQTRLNVSCSCGPTHALTIHMS